MRKIWSNREKCQIFLTHFFSSYLIKKTGSIFVFGSVHFQIAGSGTVYHNIPVRIHHTFYQSPHPPITCRYIHTPGWPSYMCTTCAFARLGQSPQKYHLVQTAPFPPVLYTILGSELQLKKRYKVRFLTLLLLRIFTGFQGEALYTQGHRPGYRYLRALLYFTTNECGLL